MTRIYYLLDKIQFCIIYKFELNVRLNGIGTAPKPIDNVSFTKIDGKLHATTVIESRYKRKIAQYRLSDAIELFNETIQKLGFIYKAKITLSRGYVIKRLFPHKSPYITCSIFTSRYSINVDHGKLIDKICN